MTSPSGKDALEVTREQTVYITSKHRSSGSPNDFTVVMGSDLVRADSDEVMMVSVLDVVMKNTITPLQSFDNSWVVFNNNTNAYQTISIPPGFYNAYELLAYMQSQLPGWNITYASTTNKYTWQTPGGVPYSFIFNGYGLQNSACSFLGFTQQDFPTGTSFTSTQAIDLAGEEFLYIMTNLPMLREANVTNMTGQFTSSNILMKLPVSAVPFGTIVYNDINDAYSILLSQSHLNTVRFTVVNEDGLPVVVPDWSISLKIKYLKKSNMQTAAGLLQELKELSVMKWLSSTPPKK